MRWKMQESAIKTIKKEPSGGRRTNGTRAGMHWSSHMESDGRQSNAYGKSIFRRFSYKLRTHK